MNEFDKKLIFLRGWLHGRGYHNSLRALEYMRERHTGTRKDGVTPSSHHQVEIALHITTLPDLIYPEDTITTGILHDTEEDTPVSNYEIVQLFGERVGAAVSRVTKYDPDGQMRDETALYADMATCPMASVVKPVDRINNEGSMGGVFDRPKTISYVDYTADNIIPMIKRARILFPQQYAAYQLLQTALKSNARLVRSLAPIEDSSEMEMMEDFEKNRV